MLCLLHSAVELWATSLRHDLVLVAWSACHVLPDYVPTMGAHVCKSQLQIVTPAMISRVMKPLCSGLVLGAGGVSRLMRYYLPTVAGQI